MEQLSALLTGLASGQGARRTSPAMLLWSFTATLFLSALMLFSVQPMFAKMALPLLGGTPAVWAVSMCFFQGALLAGYCYAHALMRWLKPKQAVAAHAALLIATFVALPIALPAGLGEPPEGDAYVWLLGVLALGVGLPFFTVSASAPLLQAWFAKTGHEDAADPYFLYGASNLGSLIALLAYPLILEPRLGLAAQSELWTAGYLVLGALITSCGWLMLQARSGGDVQNAEAAADAAAPAPPLTAGQRATWMALAAIPSGLMVAVTTYITTDVASAPFIWVVPLAMFLLTFILVFRDKLAFRYAWAQTALPVTIIILVFFAARLSALVASLVAFFLAAIICHRELYLRRPDARHLTEFYIWMSAGGVAGGVFSAIVAPQIFASVIEFKLLLLMALLCRKGVLLGLGETLSFVRLAAASTMMAAAFLGYKELVAADVLSATGPALGVLIMVSLGGLFLTRRWTEHRALLVLAMIIGVAVIPSDTRTLYLERSFFGTLRVVETAGGQHHMMLHGTTVHGAERVKTAEGAPVTAPVPATYYNAVSGPMAGAIALARDVARARGLGFTAGVVGLGAGSLACFAEPGDAWSFFEIDPMVARVARNPALFRFLPHCLPDNRIVFGDARLTLQKEPAAAFNYLVIDAFSSDAIPVHLLTREALQMYLGKLAPGGMIAIHISNRFLDLAPAVGATVATIPGVTAFSVYPSAAGPIPDSTRSRVIFLTRDADAEAAVKKRWPDGAAPDSVVSAAWTDDYSDVLSALTRGLRGF